MNGMHDPGELSAHALGLLSGAQARAVEQHLAGCAACRLEWSELRESDHRARCGTPGDVPGRPAGERPRCCSARCARSAPRPAPDATGAGSARSRRPPWSRPRCSEPARSSVSSSPRSRAWSPPPPAVPAPPPAPVPEGALTAEGSQGPVTMSATITPANGWVRLAATVRGIPPGERCSLIVLAKDGSEHLAGSWLVGQPEPGPRGPVAGQHHHRPGRGGGRDGPQRGRPRVHHRPGLGLGLVTGMLPAPAIVVPAAGRRSQRSRPAHIGTNGTFAR